MKDLKDYLRYDPETGYLYWTENLSPNAMAGYRAGCASCSDGYERIEFEGRQIRSHVAAWYLHTGEMPVGMVDHKDGEGLNNKWENLRLADTSQNTFNIGIKSNNTSGHKGVYWCNTKGKWKWQVDAYGKRKSGSSHKLEDAIDMAKKTRAIMHGEFANNG